MPALVAVEGNAPSSLRYQHNVLLLNYTAMATRVGLEPTILFLVPEPKSGDLPISLPGSNYNKLLINSTTR